MGDWTDGLLCQGSRSELTQPSLPPRAFVTPTAFGISEYLPR